MFEPLVTINLVVRNGERYIRHCLEAVKKQTYKNLEVIIFDNASTDNTRNIVKDLIRNWEPVRPAGGLEIRNFRLIENSINLGTWSGQEKALEHSNGKYIVALSVDVMLDPNFVSEAVKICELDSKIGALQAKIYQYEYPELEAGIHTTKPRLLDTCGFKITRSRRITNIGQGEEDNGQFDQEKEIFAVEGAAPFLRREAIEDSRIHGNFTDHDYFWYGDDLDYPWRMRLLGWKQYYSPTVVAYHDRSTTKAVSTTPILGQLRRVKERQKIPLLKRRLDWANVRFTIIKNDYIINIFKDLPYILFRELSVLVYILLFEPKVFGEIPRMIRLLPRMLARRKEIMRRARVPASEMHRWFL